MSALEEQLPEWVELGVIEPVTHPGFGPCTAYFVYDKEPWLALHLKEWRDSFEIGFADLEAAEAGKPLPVVANSVGAKSELTFSEAELRWLKAAVHGELHGPTITVPGPLSRVSALAS